MKHYSLEDLLYLMQRLRDPESGCPWDRAQSAQTIAPHTLEECYELIDAIETDDTEQIRQELGDLLFQVVFYAQLANEKNEYGFSDIVNELVSKLVRRHPHVFSDGELRTVNQSTDSKIEDIKETWETIKQQERGAKDLNSVLDDIPNALPSILRAVKLQKRASRVGFDWESVEGVYEKIQEEIQEIKEAPTESVAAEVGDLLFACVNLARHLGVEPEQALRQTNRRFEQRFRFIEASLAEEGVGVQQASLEKMDQLWEMAKLFESKTNDSAKN